MFFFVCLKLGKNISIFSTASDTECSRYTHKNQVFSLVSFVAWLERSDGRIAGGVARPFFAIYLIVHPHIQRNAQLPNTILNTKNTNRKTRARHSSTPSPTRRSFRTCLCTFHCFSHSLLLHLQNTNWFLTDCVTARRWCESKKLQFAPKNLASSHGRVLLKCDDDFLWNILNKYAKKIN